MGTRPQPGRPPATPDSRNARPGPLLTEPLSLSFTNTEPGTRYCLSNCSQDEVRAVMDALRMFTTMRWIDVMQSGGKAHGKKTGLHYEVHSDTSLKVRRPSQVSPDVRIASFRASRRFRVYGYHLHGVFHVLWFDRFHEICPG